MPTPTTLPIWKIHSDILHELQDGNRLVLVAPTGSGKTTQVPQMLLDAGFADDDKMILVLQPRRIAARTVATRVASERSCQLGGEVGYQIRFDDHISVGTRIWFVTEGILLRWLQNDCTLPNIAAVVFDEFHERNLLSDVALALVKRLQQNERPDLLMLVTSATLDAEPVAAYLGGCPILISEGKSYPVEVNYLTTPTYSALTHQAADAVKHILYDESPGDILVFMPGRGEINRTLDALKRLRTHERVACIPLHGGLEPKEQDHAFSRNNRRKVIVATNVAETSITIDGIRHVVDSGIARVARYDAERGIGTLSLEPISRASADQRKGRAGRTAEGTCHRLWTVISHKDREERNTPEIQRSDLAEVVLLLHSLGIQEAASFDWLDKPDPQAVARAERLLTMLGALQEAELTNIGRIMLRLPMHPRYSRMLIEASQRGCVHEAALCAALVSGRDLLARLDPDDSQTNAARELFKKSKDSDFITLVRAYEFAKENRFRFASCRSYGINVHVARQVDETYKQILLVAQQQGLCDGGATSGNTAKDEEPLLRCLMAGFADQLAKRREPGQPECDLTEQRQGKLVRESVVQDADFFVAANLREAPSRGPDSLTLLSLATRVNPDWIAEMFPQHLNTSLEHLFDATNKRVSSMKLLRYGNLVLEQKSQHRDLDPAASGRCLAEAHLRGAFELPLLNHRLKQFIARVNLIHDTLPELQLAPFDANAITACLAHAFRGLTLVKKAQSAPLINTFQRHLKKGQLSWLDELLPSSIPWLDKRPLKISYINGKPEAQVKLNECFAISEHPTVCDGSLAVCLSVCTPDGKKLASTTDLQHFIARDWPKHRPVVARKFPGHIWH